MQFVNYMYVKLLLCSVQPLYAKVLQTSAKLTWKAKQFLCTRRELKKIYNQVLKIMSYISRRADLNDSKKLLTLLFLKEYRYQNTVGLGRQL